MQLDHLKGKHILVTGGAGFIGSNLAETLLSHGAKVTVFDNLETGKKQNIEGLLDHPDFKFLEGDIREYEACLNALNDVDMVSHQAALGSVPRSIEFPHRTHEVNATGFLNMLHAAKEKGVKRFVYASSSSVYGDIKSSPKQEGKVGDPLSPYAVTKSLNEKYALVYHHLHGMETVGLRYFNVFGPKQDPNGVYAAAIPKFIHKMIQGEEIIVHGDGEQTRDFTYVANAVKANILGLINENLETFGKVYNVACGQSYSLNEVLSEISFHLKELGKYNEKTKISYGPTRKGDVRDSLADISLIQENLGYQDPIEFRQGIKELCDLIKS